MAMNSKQMFSEKMQKEKTPEIKNIPMRKKKKKVMGQMFGMGK